MLATWDPRNQLSYFVITQGTTFHLEWPPFADTTTGEAFDFTTDPEGTWHAALDMRDDTGQLLATFRTAGHPGGAGDGTITLGADGRVELDASDTFTATLPITRDYVDGNTRGTVHADLVLTDPADDSDWTMLILRGVIAEPITGGA